MPDILSVWLEFVNVIHQIYMYLNLHCVILGGISGMAVIMA